MGPDGKAVTYKTFETAGCAVDKENSEARDDTQELPARLMEHPVGPPCPM